jgi:hypothetical protein
MSKKPISKPQKGLPPDKHNNHLFAEQLTLKLNVLASDSGIFPQGLGNLIYDNSTVKGSNGPFDGMTVRAILDSVDVYLGCRGAVSGTDDSTEFLKVDSLINASFAAPLDTTSWGCVKVVCTGVRTLDDVPYLHPNPNPAPLLMFPPMTAARIYVPTTFSLNQNYPNPFNPTTVISFQLQYPSLVTIKIYNILGQEIATLLDRGEMDDGEQEIEFNASSLPSGVYFYHLKAESIPDEDEGVGPMTFTAVRKMVLVK